MDRDPRSAIRCLRINTTLDRTQPLLDLDLTPGLLELLRNALGLSLVDALFDVLGGAIHEILSLLETETGELADDLDDLDLLVAGALENDRELVLLLHRRRTGHCCAGHGRHHGRRRAHAEL